MKKMRIKQYSIFTIQYEEEYIYNYILIGDKLYNTLQNCGVYGIENTISIDLINDDLEYENNSYFDSVKVTRISEPRYYEQIYGEWTNGRIWFSSIYYWAIDWPWYIYNIII